jgi:hypothetical protein
MRAIRYGVAGFPASWETSSATREDLGRFILPQRRDRSYPRAVKIKMSNYPRKRPAPAAAG